MRQAFTIVELLIVVVVIAVLAAITVVSYNGITEQAKRAAAKTDIASISKALEMRSAEGKSLAIATEPGLREAGLAALLSKSTVMTYATFESTFSNPSVTPSVDVPRGNYVIFPDPAAANYGNFALAYWNYDTGVWNIGSYRQGSGMQPQPGVQFLYREGFGSGVCGAANLRDCVYPVY